MSSLQVITNASTTLSRRTQYLNPDVFSIWTTSAVSAFNSTYNSYATNMGTTACNQPISSQTDTYDKLAIYLNSLSIIGNFMKYNVLPFYELVTNDDSDLSETAQAWFQMVFNEERYTAAPSGLCSLATLASYFAEFYDPSAACPLTFGGQHMLTLMYNMQLFNPWDETSQIYSYLMDTPNNVS